MIRVENVTKRFGNVVAVDSVSFAIGAGEIVGFLGKNGAGKSTLLKMLCTWLPPTRGTITVAGRDAVREPLAVRSAVGYLPEHNALYEGMKVDRFLRFAGRLRGLDGARYAARRDWVVEHCGLEAVFSRWIHECSKGYRQRIGLAAALLHDPPVLILDEPTHGLDALQVAAFRDFIRGLRSGRAILFSSHVLAEVTSISQRLLIINDGVLLADAPVADLRAQAAARGRDLDEAVLDLVRTAGGRP